MSETHPDLECAKCLRFITRYEPGTGWVCRWCGPRTREEVRPPRALTTIQLTARSLGCRSVLRIQMPETDVLGAPAPTEERVFQMFDGASTQHHKDFLRYVLDIFQFKFGEEFEGGWWIACKRPSDPNYKNPYAEPEPKKIRGTDHVIYI